MSKELTYAPRYTVADAFCGCGGLSLGLSLTQRFDVILGTDIKPEALETFKYNHSTLGGIEPVTIAEDIRQSEGETLMREMLHHGIERAGDLDCLIGGPPCEGFSQNRVDKTNGAGSRSHKFIDDPRNFLFRWFVALAATIQPKVVLIENVPDLVRHRDGETREEILAALDEAGYVATVRVLNTADYGVPQLRRRAFFLAQRKDDLKRSNLHLEFPLPTHKPYPMSHSSLMADPDWLPGDSGYWVTVREAIGDLPAAAENDEYDHEAAKYPDAKITTFRAMMRSKDGVPYNHIARKLGKNGLAKLKALEPGQLAADLPDDLRPKAHYHYSYTRMLWSQPSRTITKFVYHVGSGQFGHPVEDRAVTIREAARLQSFPDDFKFVGTSEIRKLSALVGSAVPPLLGKALGKQIAQYLDALYLHTMKPEERSEAKLLAGDAVMKRLEREEWTNKKKAPEPQKALF